MDCPVEGEPVDVQREMHVSPAAAILKTDLWTPETNASLGSCHEPDTAVLFAASDDGQTKSL